MEQRMRDINEWMEVLERQIAATGNLVAADVESAMSQVTEESDKGLYGRCHFYKAFYLLRNGRPNDCLQHLNEAIRCMVGTSQERQAARCYNILGVVAHGQNNLLLAAEQYNKALNYAEKYSDFYTRSMAGSNLADVYYRIGLYDKAFWWYRESMKSYERTEAGLVVGSENHIKLLACYGFCLLLAGKRREAGEVYDRLRSIENGEHAENFPTLCAYTFFALYFYQEKQEQQAEECLNVAVSSILRQEKVTQDADNILNLIELLILMERYDSMGRLLDYMEPLARAEGNEGILLQILTYQLKYCASEMSKEQYLERTNHFLRIKEEYEEQENGMILHMLEMRRQLLQIEEAQQELEKENVKLRYQAEHDELSGLYNKGKLSRYAEEAFEKALRNRLPLGVLFADIDYFKQMNDRYGHGRGDECIRAVAECIRSCMPEDFVARYGGDEFVVIAQNRTEEYMRRCGERLVRAVQALQISNEDSGDADILTVTVGIAHAVPTRTNKVWDFLSAADETLYRQKNEKRGCMRFCGSLGEKNGSRTISR